MEKQNQSEGNKNYVFIDDPNLYFTTLNKVSLESYQELGYTLKSICNLCQTALLNQIQNPKWTEHDLWDVYNALKLLKELVPYNEMEVLDMMK